MKITKAVLDKLSEEAKISPRLRMNYDLRDSESDSSQRMLNAIEPGSIVPIHRHQKSSETIVCIQGKVVVEYFDDLRRICEEAIELSKDGQTIALSIPIGQWHTVRAVEHNTVILEMKNGPYEPLSAEDVL